MKAGRSVGIGVVIFGIICVSRAANAEAERECLQEIQSVRSWIAEAEKRKIDNPTCVRAITDLRQRLDDVAAHCSDIRYYDGIAVYIVGDELGKDAKAHYESADAARKIAEESCPRARRGSWLVPIGMSLIPVGVAASILAAVEWRDPATRPSATATIAVAIPFLSVGATSFLVGMMTRQDSPPGSLKFAMLPIIVERGAGLTLVGKF